MAPRGSSKSAAGSRCKSYRIVSYFSPSIPSLPKQTHTSAWQCLLQSPAREREREKEVFKIQQERERERRRYSKVSKREGERRRYSKSSKREREREMTMVVSIRRMRNIGTNQQQGKRRITRRGIMRIPGILIAVAPMKNVVGRTNAAEAKQTEAEKEAVMKCTSKCVATCIRPDRAGPLTVRKEVVVFKEGFRDRKYCLSECKDVCSLSQGKIG